MFFFYLESEFADDGQDRAAKIYTYQKLMQKLKINL